LGEGSYISSSSQQAKTDQEVEAFDGSLKQDEKIFSMATIFPLIIAVLGIVAFRRNSDS
jgi:hypothetical protein